MNKVLQCVEFETNHELQDALAFFDTKEEAYEYCKKQAEEFSENHGRNVIISDPDEKEVVLYVGNNRFRWFYSDYNLKEELEKLGIKWQDYSFLNKELA